MGWFLGKKKKYEDEPDENDGKSKPALRTWGRTVRNPGAKFLSGCHNAPMYTLDDVVYCSACRKRC